MTKETILQIEETAFLAGWQAACNATFEMNISSSHTWRLVPRTKAEDAFQDWLNAKAFTVTEVNPLPLPPP